MIIPIKGFSAACVIVQALLVGTEDTLRMAVFELGVNYWPRRSAMYMWQRFDLGEVREDMAHIKSLGLQTVRFFLMWDAFQPEPDVIDETMLQRFESMMDAIADAGLQAMPTLYCGHMSGVNWLPGWTLDPEMPHGRFRTIWGGQTSPFGIGDFYADPLLLDAQALFAQKAGERVREHPALLMWDLGNEFSNLREPSTPADAAAWSARLTHVLQHASGRGATGGTHGEDVERDRNLRPSSLAKPWDIATMHGYSVYSTFSRGRLDTDVVPFYARLMQAFSQKPLLFSEFGNPTCPPGTVSPYDREPLPGEPPPSRQDLPPNAAGYACLTEDEMATYCETVLLKLHAQGCIGAMWWCWADYDASLATLPPFDRATHELHFGMIRADGTEKPVAHALSRIAARSLQIQGEPPPIAQEETFYASLPDGIRTLYHHYGS
jgi:endo-1,4-beta-mannosidase